MHVTLHMMFIYLSVLSKRPVSPTLKNLYTRLGVSPRVTPRCARTRSGLVTADGTVSARKNLLTEMSKVAMHINKGIVI